MINWTLKTFSIKDLKDNPKNPRKLSDKQYQQLKESLDKFGLIDKPICTKDGLLIGGHQRKQVLKKSGVKEVECYVPDRELEEKEIEELMLRLNRVHGDFDYDMLANEFMISDLVEWGFEAKEFDIAEPIDSEDPIEKKCKTCPNCGHEL
jgi:ParB-like chromosome segregation protein Spo0J